MKGIILAAGNSSRLYPMTLEKPKCLLEIGDGRKIIDYQVSALNREGIDDVVVVVGCEKEQIQKHLGNSVRYREFGDFEKFNNLHTLYSVRDELDEDSVILYSDVIFSHKLMRRCVWSEEDYCLLVHNKEVLENTARVKIRNGGIVDIGNHINPIEGDGNFVGVAKYSENGLADLVEEIGMVVEDPDHNNDYYISPLVEIAKRRKVGFEFAGDEPWMEMDYLEDYEKAKKEIWPLLRSQ